MRTQTHPAPSAFPVPNGVDSGRPMVAGATVWLEYSFAFAPF
jgi:hypothetical protein